MPTPSTADILQRLHEFLVTEIIDDEEVTEVDADENLLTSGLVDSTGAMRLALQVETVFGVEIEPGEFTLANFHCLSALTALVGRKLGLTEA